MSFNLYFIEFQSEKRRDTLDLPALLHRWGSWVPRLTQADAAD